MVVGAFFQLSVSKTLKCKAESNPVLWLVFPSCVFQQVQACSLESDFIQFIGGHKEERAGSECRCRQWVGGRSAESVGCAHFTLTVRPETEFGQQPLTSLLCHSCFSLLVSPKTEDFIFLVILCSYLFTEKEVGWTRCFSEPASVPTCTHSKLTPPTFLKFSKTNSDTPGLC